MRALPAALLLAALAAAAPARAQEFEVPPGFVTVQEPPGEREGLQYLYTIRPAEGSFAELSSIRLSRLVQGPEDPDAWLRDRVSADVGEASSAEDLFESPDSPFSDPAFETLRRAIPELFAGLESLGELPLEFCEGPSRAFNASGAYRELYCAFDFGPVRQYLVLRLQAAGEAWYFTEVRTMNERRLRTLLGVADTFVAGQM